MQYARCGMEGVDVAGNLVLLTNVPAQMSSPRAFLYQQDSAKHQIDAGTP
jgi:hypothetical protein